MYFYWAYGLRVRSELEFPELFPIEVASQVDVEIVIEQKGGLFTELNVAKPHSVFIQSTDFKMNVQDVATYHVKNGSIITIYPCPGASNSDIRVYCLSNAFAAILHQQKKLPLHAGAIHFQDQLVLIMGESGAGKTTLLFNLLENGFRIFSDDVVVLSEQQIESVNCNASYPLMKIWKEQVKKIGISLEVPIRKGVEKYPLYFHEEFDCSSLPPLVVVILKISSVVNNLECRELKGVESVMELTHHLYRKEYMLGDEMLSHLPLLSRLANQCRFIEITRPVHQNKEQELLELFIKEVSV